MDSHMAELVGQVVTVRGPIPAAQLGVTLPHEHLLAVHQGPVVDTTDPVLAREELQRVARFGGHTVVDMTSIGLGRSPRLIRQIADEAGVQVVMGTGFYKDAWLPSEVHDMTVEELAALMIGDIVEGADGTGIRAGVIGETGVSRPTTPTEERVLAAAARAQRTTGAAINVHFDIGGKAPEYNHALDILQGEGADLRRVVLDHFSCRPDELELCCQLASRGPCVEFDLWGLEVWPKIVQLTGAPPEVQLATLPWFISAGLLEHILISQDLGHQPQLRRNGGFGQAHILRNLLPRFREVGVTDADIGTIMVENPRRLFPVQLVPSG